MQSGGDAGSAGEHQATILVVDDTPQNIRLQSTILRHHGYRVISASSGEEALTSIAAEEPDLVLLDVLMPGLDGYAVCARLRASPATRFLPTIMITASGEQEKVRALEAGADDFLQKPLNQAELLARVRTLLRMKRYHDTIERQTRELAEWTDTLEARVNQQVDELERLGRLRRFLSPQLAEMLVSAEGEALLEIHRRLIAVLCCRLVGFTAVAESAAPEEVLGLLREYYEVLGPLLQDFEATVGGLDEDRVRVLFNDPLPCDDPAGQAVKLAVAIRDRLQEPLAQWRRRGYELAFTAGVDQGYATLGTIGLAGRTEYAAVGTANRLAAGLAERAQPGQILVSQRIFVDVDEHVDAQPIDDLVLEGFSRPVRALMVRSLVPRGADPATPEVVSAGRNRTLLTERESEVVELIVRGFTNRQIAEALVIAEGTAVRHVANILGKLGLRSRAQVAAWAVEQSRTP
jgi:adenylate cyclase